ncbi:uncharacterized protein LOC127253519 isoform X2 [Andrographis paniculata]|uniref:uncharacterized protein LOC127253519 isoform X2 n=1 Tax=Andrographis paniculata TaxID=175694 RepID=UPI0021E91AD8|nr:uncharacterized protein LOC127253519 isoform X2 [Andrographis paniculata]
MRAQDVMIFSEYVNADKLFTPVCVMGKSQRAAVGGSQDPAVSPARRFTRASARNSPLEATHPASRNPSPIRNPTKKVTKRKGSRVSPLLQRLRSITSEWEKERDARGQSMKPTSSTRRAVLQDSEGPLEEHDDRDVPSLFDPTALTQDDDDTIPPTQADDETLPLTQDMETAESDMPLLDEGPGSDPTLMTGTEAGNMAPLDEMTSHDAGSSKKKQGRGAARMPRGWGKDHRMLVFTSPDGKSIVGPDVNEYKTAIGVIARNGARLPLHYPTFAEIPETKRQGAWMEVQSNSGLPDSAEKVVLADLREVWRHWKYSIKSTYFNPIEDDEEALKKVPSSRIVPDQWPKLVEYWRDEKVKLQSKKNASNVAKRSFPHRTGRKSFTTLAEEIKAKGKDPDNLEIWISSRTQGKGKDDQETEEILNELNKVPPEGRTPSVRETLYRRALGGKIKKRSKVDSAASSAHPRSESTGLTDSVAFQHGWEQLQNGMEELKAMMDEFKTIKVDVYAFMHRNSGAVTGQAGTSRIDSVPEIPRPVSEPSMTVGTHVLLLSHTGEKKVVAEGLLLCPPGPGDTLSLVKVFVTSASVPDTPLILPTISGATTLRDVVGEDPIEWSYNDLMRRT